MKYFNEEYRTRLYKTIELLENNSLVEIVVIAKERSNNYRDVALIFAFVLMSLVFTLLMFLPIDFTTGLVYFATLLTFFLSFTIVSYLPALKRMLLKKEKMRKTAEITGRAIFQKGGIRFTDQKIGILIYVSDFEQTVCVLADRGAETSIPEEDWQMINKGFDEIYTKLNPATALLDHLESLKDTFNQYIPPIENDINELPDDLEVEL